MDIIEKIHAAPLQVVIVTAGAGQGAISSLLAVPGASRTLLEAVVPYSQRSFDDFLGHPPKQYVSDEAARLLAGRAYTRARQLRADAEPIAGLSCTATIVTDRHKKGSHRGHVALWLYDKLVAFNTELTKGARTRAEEESIYSHIMLNALAEASGVPERFDIPLLPDERIETTLYDFGQMAHGLNAGELRYFGIHDHGQIRTTDAHPQTLLSGSFNPLHDGHLGMAKAASQLLGRPVAFELSAFNVDKPPLDPEHVLERISQFAGRHPIYVSNAPTYVEKSRLYPGATFIIGFDTAVRLFNPKYYNQSHDEMLGALAELQMRGCRFLVAGRSENDHFRTLAEIDIPAEFAALFQAMPEALFRLDLSSTELRASGDAGSR